MSKGRTPTIGAACLG